MQQTPHHTPSGRRLRIAGAAALVIGLGLAPTSASFAASTHQTYLDVVELGISGSLDLLGSGQTTSAELTETYLARIDAYNPQLNAIISVNPNALADAAASDARRAAGEPLGRLEGVPIVVKDNMDMAGTATTNGAVAFEDYLPANDATVIGKLKAAGAIIIAKANLSEFAWSASSAESVVGGKTHNPYDLTRTSTGSSGGSAAAVAASLGAGALGTDSWGSIRNPATHQALIGVRPTHGLVSLAGVTALVTPLDSVGPMTLTVEDAALLLDVIAGSDPADPFSAEADAHVPASYRDSLSATSLAGKTIGVVTDGDYWGAGVDFGEYQDDNTQVVALVRAAIDEFEARGATVVPVSVGGINGLGWGGTRYWMDRHLAENEASFNPTLAALTAPADVLSLSDYLADGRAWSDIQAYAGPLLSEADLTEAKIEAGQAAIDAGRAALASLFAANALDALAYPGDPQVAMPVDTADNYWNGNHGIGASLGVPTISIPVGYTDGGLPASVQLLGLPYTEADLLSMAYDFEQATGGMRIAPASTPGLPVAESAPTAMHPATGAHETLTVMALAALAVLSGVAVLGARRFARQR